MNSLYAFSSDNPVAKGAVLTVPIAILPEFEFPQQCAYIMKVIRSLNVVATSSIAEALRNPSTTVGQMIYCEITNAVTGLCGTSSGATLAKAGYVHFIPSASMTSSLSALGRWLDSGVSIERVETVFEEGMTQRNTDDSVVQCVLMTSHEYCSLDPYDHVAVRVAVTFSDLDNLRTLKGLKNYIKSIDNKLFIGLGKGLVMRINGCKTEISATALNSFGSPDLDDTNARWQLAVRIRMEEAVDNLVISDECLEALLPSSEEKQVPAVVVFSGLE